MPGSSRPGSDRDQQPLEPGVLTLNRAGVAVGVGPRTASRSIRGGEGGRSRARRRPSR